MDQLEEAKGPEFGKNWAEHAAYKNLKHHQKHLEKHVRYSERYGNKANDFADSAHSVFNKMINAKSYEDGQKHMALLQNHLKNMHQHLKMEKHHDKWAGAHEKM